MRYKQIISEAIHAPFSEQIRALIQLDIKTAKTPEDLRKALEDHLTTFFQAKLDAMNVRRRMTLHVYLLDPTEKHPSGGYFRVEDDGSKTGLPPLADNEMEIVLVMPEGRTESLLNPWSYQQEENIDQLAQIAQHEFIHAIQFVKSMKYRTLARYTLGRTRPKVDDKRVGKRGGYVGWGVPARQYLGQEIEIAAHAAQAAAEIIYRARKEDPDKQIDYIKNVLRTMRSSSMTMSNYREQFKNPNLFGMMRGAKSDPRMEKQRAIVWALFKRQLAQHLMDYVEARS